MKSIIIYFSQTGNTESIAVKIREGIIETAGHCDIVKIRDIDSNELFNYDLVGIGCPVIQWVEPSNVKTFINTMRFSDGKHIFAFCTHGAHGEMFFSSIIPRLRNRGFLVIGARDWYGDCFLSYMPHPYPTTGHPDELDLSEAKTFGKEVSELSMRIYQGESELIPKIELAKLSLPNHQKDFGKPELVELTRSMIKFHKEKCRYPNCLLCMENCPVNGIDLSVKPYIVAKPCIKCQFCTMICPTGAIENNAFSEAMASMHPKKFDEYIMKPLAEAEKAGKFRRLVSVEEINYNLPIFKSHPGHPKWIAGKGLQ